MKREIQDFVSANLTRATFDLKPARSAGIFELLSGLLQSVKYNLVYSDWPTSCLHGTRKYTRPLNNYSIAAELLEITSSIGDVEIAAGMAALHLLNLVVAATQAF